MANSVKSVRDGRGKYRGDVDEGLREKRGGRRCGLVRDVEAKFIDELIPP